jgi:P27 family predicted phage terminase small subunit
MRGRKPKVNPVHKRANKPQTPAVKVHSKRTTPAPKPRGAAPIPPVPTVSARTFEDEYKTPLIDAGVVTDSDTPALKIMSQAYWIADKAVRQLETEPFTRDDENGIERKSPWLQIWRDAATTFRAYASEFGMTPVARARVTPAPQKKKSLAEILFEGVTKNETGDED